MGPIFENGVLIARLNCVRLGATAPYMEILGGVHLA